MRRLALHTDAVTSSRHAASKQGVYGPCDQAPAPSPQPPRLPGLPTNNRALTLNCSNNWYEVWVMGIGLYGLRQFMYDKWGMAIEMTQKGPPFFTSATAHDHALPQQMHDQRRHFKSGQNMC